MAKIKGLVFVDLSRRQERERVKKIKESAKQVEEFGVIEPIDISLEVLEGEEGCIIYAKLNTRDQNGDEVHPRIGTVYVGIQISDSIRNKFAPYGEFLSFEEIKELEKGAEFELVGALQGGNTVVVKATQSNRVVVSTDTSKSIYKTVGDILKEVAERTGLSDSQIDERVAYLEKNGVTPKKTPLLFILTLLLIFPQKENIKRPKKFYIHNVEGESLIKRILRNVALGDPIILEGPKSTGKNVAWETISWLLNRPIEVLNCSARMTYATMFGSPQTDDTAKDKITLEGAKSFIKSFFSKKENDDAAEFLKNLANCMAPSVKTIPGPVSRAIMSARERGTILIADELNLSDPNTFSGAFNGLTDKHTVEYNISGIGVVQIPHGFIVGGTQNATGGTYLGTKQQNQATMSRFNVIRLSAPGSIKSVLMENNHMDFLNEKIGITVRTNNDEEDEKLQRVCEDSDVLNFSKYEELCANYSKFVEVLDIIYKDFQDLVEAGSSTEDCLNVRGFERALSHVLLGETLKESINECVINTCPEDMRLTLEMTVDNNQTE